MRTPMFRHGDFNIMIEREDSSFVGRIEYPDKRRFSFGGTAMSRYFLTMPFWTDELALQEAKTIIRSGVMK